MLHNMNSGRKFNLCDDCLFINDSFFPIVMGMFSVWMFGITFFHFKFFTEYHDSVSFQYSKLMFDFSFFLNLFISSLTIVSYFDLFFFSLTSDEKKGVLRQLRKENCILCFSGLITIVALIIDMNISLFPDLDTLSSIFIIINIIHFIILMVFFCSSIFSLCFKQKKYHNM